MAGSTSVKPDAPRPAAGREGERQSEGCKDAPHVSNSMEPSARSLAVL
jgi:hypothetical protein